MVLKIKAVQLIPLCLILSLSSCSQLAKSSEQANPVQTTTESADPVAKTDLTGEDLFHLLLAEIATNRRDYGAAASLYNQLSSKHKDIAVIERAAALSQSVGDYKNLAIQSDRWVAEDPENPRAYPALAISKTAMGDTVASQQALANWLALDANADISVLLPALEGLNQAQREAQRTQLIQLQKQHPKSPSLLYTLSRLSFALGYKDEAITQLDQSIALDENLQVSLFKYQILLADKKSEEARDLIYRLYDEYPSNPASSD